ncbi:hypothetical protein SAMN05216223_12848 [Actinacidiphila yanglinensis]|uniref:Integral membrane protein n=1 Tax=Actinacidiphila yanglinensis TaxID=310779 RepID=A0A1H6E7L0_9ACTN|nr:hypothetical protein [Actinacidiphila yanglinensis]SEG93677.1 hypothetical protein SAMN05216223_12848 [Actinacidiphila yanglinensis]
MVRGAYTLARVAVTVRVAAAWLWWLGVIAAIPGTAVTFSPTGRRIGVMAGVVLFLLAAVIASLVRGGRHGERAKGASRAAKSVFLQDRKVTARAWVRRRRWWLVAAFVVAAAANAVLPCAAGMLLGGVGAGLWVRSRRVARLERSRDALLWVRPDGDPALYQLTGTAAGDAAPGGGRRR